MSFPKSDSSQGIDAIAEAQLQQELYGLFLLDLQNYLQKYSQIAQSLQAQSWRTDIQELYRCIHTIKGGAVTVGAEAFLQIATALEDVLSDLRYLELSPPLSDGHLSQALREAGELLTISVEFQKSEENDPILNRIQVLHEEIQERYLPQWNEIRQLHQEFAQQGLDLVVLELEIALERLPAQGRVPERTLDTARQTLEQLEQIGSELQLATGWTELLLQAQMLLNRPEIAVWRSQWSCLFQALKTCAKQSGKPVPFRFTTFDASQEDQGDKKGSPAQPTTHDLTTAGTDALADVGIFLDGLNLGEYSAMPEMVNFLDAHPLEDSTDLTNVAQPIDELNLADNLTNSEDSQTILGQGNSADGLPDFSQVQEWLNQTDQDNFVANFLTQIQEQGSAVDEPQTLQSPPVLTDTAPSQQEQPSAVLEKVQIPVPLEKLDQSAQYLVETLLALRSTKGFYQTLQNQIAQLVTLAQEGVQAIAHLRQLQDDYVLLDQLSNSTQTASTGPTPERYRQGYSIINRLLETNLRLSEIGAETGKTSERVAEYLQNVDNNVLKLQNTIEDSRLVPFQNLGFRARAILRDLTTRHGKPAQLVVQGEQTELDVHTARNLEPLLLHLIRNAYDHGLESPAERVAQNKPERGTITLSLRRQGNLFEFELKDDGCGIDAKAVQSRAEALRLPLSSTQTSGELLAVICQPGFSSRSQVNEISGRGIGMDVIAAQVDKLGGRLTLHTVQGAGTTFHLKFPVPRLLVSCVVLRSGDSTFALPVDDIKTIDLLCNLNVSLVKDSNQAFSRMIEDETGSLPALDLLKYWQPRCADRPLADTTVCLYIYGQEIQQNVWLLADELIEHSEIIINPLPKPLVAPDGLIGVSLQPNGALFPVLEAQKLVEQLLSSSLEAFEAATIPASEPSVGKANDPTQSILIVDDAALMRRRLEATLNTCGYLTHTCNDGQEAWHWLQAHLHPTLVITDVEMPNMDGFTLVDRCRQAGLTVPILVISSRLSEEWLDEARRLGATDYLTKGFSTIDLIKKVSALLGNSQTINNPAETQRTRPTIQNSKL